MHMVVRDSADVITEGCSRHQREKDNEKGQELTTWIKTVEKELKFMLPTNKNGIQKVAQDYPR